LRKTEIHFYPKWDSCGLLLEEEEGLITYIHNLDSLAERDHWNIYLVARELCARKEGKFILDKITEYKNDLGFTNIDLARLYLGVFLDQKYNDQVFNKIGRKGLISALLLAISANSPPLFEAIIKSLRTETYNELLKDPSFGSMITECISILRRK
jgi:hypothetical protein